MKLHNFDFSKKIFYHPEQIVKYKKKERPFPITMEIDLTNRCNHKCTFCFYAEHISVDKSTLKYEVLTQRIEELAKLGCKGISFTGGGEPTLHPKFKDILIHTNKLNIDCGLITNGSVIHRFAEELVQNLKWIRISLAGGDKESYKKVQGVDQFERIIRNIKILSEKKVDLNSNLNIGVRVLVTPDNINCIENLANLLKDSAINYIQFAPDMFTKDEGRFWNSEETQKIFKNTNEILSKNNILQLTAGYLKHQDNLDYVKTCYAHFFQAALTAEGNMLFCKNARDDKKFNLGNIYENTFTEIWQDKLTKELESYISPSNCGLFCKCMQLNVAMQDSLFPSDDMSPNFVT